MLYLAKLKYAGASAPGSRTPRNTCTIHMRISSITTENRDDSRCSDGSGRAGICWIPRHLQSPALSTLTRQQLSLYREGNTRLDPHPWQKLTQPALPQCQSLPAQNALLLHPLHPDRAPGRPCPRHRDGPSTAPLTDGAARGNRPAPQAARMRGPAARAGKFKPASRPFSLSGQQLR